MNDEDGTLAHHPGSHLDLKTLVRRERHFLSGEREILASNQKWVRFPFLAYSGDRAMTAKQAGLVRQAEHLLVDAVQ